MSNNNPSNLDEVDLKTPTLPYAEPPPPYNSIGFEATNPSASPQLPYPAVDPPRNTRTVSFSNTTQEYPAYPVGTGAYPGAGSYCPDGTQHTTYVVRTVYTPHHCEVARAQRRRRIFIILFIFIIFVIFSSVAWAIFDGS